MAKLRYAVLLGLLVLLLLVGVVMTRRGARYPEAQVITGLVEQYLADGAEGHLPRLLQLDP
jgi:hypothetical protein